jgi:hypothetical protein
MVYGVVKSGATQVGVDGKSDANVIGVRKILLCVVTAVVFTV